MQNEEALQLSKIVVGLLLVLAGVIFATVRVVQSLSEQKAQTQLLQEREHLLYTDALTGFYNRNHFSHRAEALRAGHYPQAVLVADLNNLKRVNDTLGHAAGDALIVAFALALREQFPGAKLFRMGGDEFLVLVDGMSEAQLVEAIRQLQDRCTRPVEGGAVPSAAIGYAIRYGDGDGLDAAIAAADARMYHAKTQIGGRRASDA